MPIENRNLEAGTRLVARYKKTDYVCVVGSDEEGRLNFTVEGIDKTFTSPSQAGSAVMGGTACNGWRFWSVEGQEAPRAEKGAKREAKAKAPRQPKAKAERKPRASKLKLFERVPNKDGDAEGQNRFWCHGCQASFLSESAKPEACDKGHKADDPELTSAPVAVEA